METRGTVRRRSGLHALASLRLGRLFLQLPSLHGTRFFSPAVRSRLRQKLFPRGDAFARTL